jgi:hypothetical protein
MSQRSNDEANKQATKYLKKNFNSAMHKNLSDICQLLYPVKNALYHSLQRSRITADLGSVYCCEASFSILTCRITPHRRVINNNCHDSQTQSKSGTAQFLVSRTESIDFEDFLVHFRPKNLYTHRINLMQSYN